MQEKTIKFKEGFIATIQCRSCIHICKDCVRGGKCEDFMQVDKIEQKKLLYQIRHQGMNIGKFCKKHHLKAEYFNKMIRGKIPYTFKAYTKLLERLKETEEWEYEEKRFDSLEAII